MPTKLSLLLGICLTLPNVSIASTYENHCVPDVNKSFGLLDSNGTPDRIDSIENFLPDTFVQTLSNHFGLDNHFQGVQALPDGEHFVFSGGNYKIRQASLFIARIHSDGGSKVIKRIDFEDKVHWHLGGIGRLGDLIALPFESFHVGETSIIQFYDFSDPENPVKLPIQIDRPFMRAGSIGLVKLDDGRTLLGVDHDGIFQFYLSKSTQILDGFSEMPVAELKLNSNLRNAQNTQFVRQCDGRIFLFSFLNTGLLAPVLNGRHLALRNELKWDSQNPKLIPIDQKRFICGSNCNFAGAVSVNSDENGRMSFLSISMYRKYKGSEIDYKLFSERTWQ